jgi:hypothetical protein
MENNVCNDMHNLMVNTVELKVAKLIDGNFVNKGDFKINMNLSVAINE